MTKKYRKRPVIVEAIRFTYSTLGILDLKKFCGEAVGDIVKTPDAKAEVQIFTLEDGKNLKAKHVATEGDYIIKGVNGEFYPIKEKIFKETYELVEG